MARQSYVPTDDEVSKAKDVLERGYRGWVNDLAEELLYEAFSEGLDEEGLMDRVRERCDSGLVYTADQWVVLFASRNTQEGWDELRDMGGNDTEDPVAAWSVITYTQDVSAAVTGSTLYEAVAEHGGEGDALINWLIEEHGSQEYTLPNDVHAWIIGDVDDVAFGILVVSEDNHKSEFIGRYIEPDALKVLMDLILEQGDPHAPAVTDFMRKAR